MGAKLTIIEGNSNDKDNTRTYMVKGEKGYSAYDLYVQHGGTHTEEQWLDEFINAENFYNKNEVDTSQTNQNNKINKKPYFFNNVAEMKAYNLQVGDMTITKGYYAENDGGSANYLIRAKTENDVDDGGSIHFVGNNLVAELIVEDYVIPEMFGAKCDGITDDSISIENAINCANFNNKKIVFSKKSYCVSKSFYIKAGISIEGNFATIIPLASDNYVNGFIFLLNSENATTWLEEYKGDCNIRNLIFDNVNEIQNIKAFYLAENNIDFFQIKTIRFYQFVKTASVYLDNVSFRKITCAYNYGTEYMFYKGGQGDGILFDACHFVADNNTLNNNGIFLSNSWGATIQNIINGHHLIFKCINTTIQDCHFERGSLVLKDSVVNVKNSYFWKNDSIVPITVIDSDKQGGYGNHNISQNYVFEQLVFELRYATYNYYSDTADVDLTNIFQEVYFKNCYRRAEPVGGVATQMTLTGIMLELETTGKKIVPYTDFMIKSRTIFTNQKILHSGLFTTTQYLLTSISETDKATANFTQLEYFYKVQNMLDIDRLLGAGTSQEKSITKTSATKSNIINIGNSADINVTLRIYRGTSSNNYTEYVDIPCPKTKALIDNGSAVNGFEWKEYSDTVIPELSYCEILTKDDNYQGNAICELGDVPPRGTWKRGDKVYNHNPLSGKAIGWVCIADGTPGIWKSFGTIE